MAVTLPPALPPQQGVAEQLQQQGSEVAAFAFQNHQVHLLGAQVLTPADLDAAARQAESLSDVVRNLSALYYAAGYPASRLTYALSGQDLYVYATLGQLQSVDGPEELKPYFNDLVGAAPLTDTALEPRRVLASVHADRAGLEVSPQLSGDAGSDRYVMNLDPLPGAPDPTTLRAEFGNPGNRFVGRHFLDLGIRHSLTTGDEFTAAWRGGLTGLNDEDDADDYHEQSLGWNRVTPWGIVGIAGRNVDYTVDLVDGFPLRPAAYNGDIQQVEAAWLYPLAASFHSRWTVNAKVDYTDKQLERAVDVPLLVNRISQNQEYGSVEAGTAYAYAYTLGNGHRLDFDAGVSVRKGLGDDKTTVADTLADLGYLLFRPQAGVRYGLTPNVNLRLDLSAQLTGDTVPEQSQWVLGGVSNLTAYLPGVIAGDSGGLARLQLDYQNLDKVYGFALSPRAFVEYGYADYENALAGTPDGTPTVADVGVELVVSFTRYLEASVAYAESFYDKDIDQSDLDDADANAYFRLTLKL